MKLTKKQFAKVVKHDSLVDGLRELADSQPKKPVKYNPVKRRSYAHYINLNACTK